MGREIINEFGNFNIVPGDRVILTKEGHQAYSTGSTTESYLKMSYAIINRNYDITFYDNEDRIINTFGYYDQWITPAVNIKEIEKNLKKLENKLKQQLK